MATSNITKPVISLKTRRSSFEKTLASARSTMMFSEVVRLAIDSFKASKVRFLLTMLGMIIGSASIILVYTLGLTGKDYALNLISSIGPNMVEMMYNGGDRVGPDNTSTPDFMTREDMQAVNEQVPGIIASSPMLETHDRISMGGGIVKDSMILGVSPQYKQVRNLSILAGRFFDDQDAISHTKVAIIVEPFAKALFGSSRAAIDRTISIRGIPFVIIGVFKESIETFGMSEVSEQTILVPYEVARYFTGTNTVKQIFFTMKDSSLVIPASQEILEIIKSRHRPTSVYTAFNLTQVLGVMGQIADMLTIVLTLAAAITLIVSGVGIMNSMLANVQSRLREIGISEPPATRYACSSSPNPSSSRSPEDSWAPSSASPSPCRSAS
jgi:putative ABC transport system permease protein